MTNNSRLVEAFTFHTFFFGEQLVKPQIEYRFGSNLANGDRACFYIGFVENRIVAAELHVTTRGKTQPRSLKNCIRDLTKDAPEWMFGVYYRKAAK